MITESSVPLSVTLSAVSTVALLDQMSLNEQTNTNTFGEAVMKLLNGCCWWPEFDPVSAPSLSK